MNHIQFKNADKKFLFPKKRELKTFVSKLFQKEKKSLINLTYIFCTDEWLLQMNQDFLEHDYYTDIITFDLSDSPEGIIGEIYISLDRIKDNAKQLNTSLREETLRVIFHGALHLCGYKDKTKNEIATMRAKEQFYLNQFSSFKGV